MRERHQEWAEAVKQRLRDPSVFLPPPVLRMAAAALLHCPPPPAGAPQRSKLAGWSRRMTVIRGAAGVDPTTNPDATDQMREERSYLDDCKHRAGAALDRLVKLM